MPQRTTPRVVARKLVELHSQSLLHLMGGRSIASFFGFDMLFSILDGQGIVGFGQMRKEAKGRQ